MTTVPLRFAPPIRCHRDLGRGELKRVAARRLLVGYYVGCPGCGAVTQAAGEAFLETLPLVELPAGSGIGARTKRPTGLATVAPVVCRGCGGGIAVRDEQVAVEPIAEAA